MSLFGKRKSDSTELYNQAEQYYKTGDYNKAVELYLSAAEQGHSGAQYSLGYCYSHGEGCSMDISTAIKWYQKAAEHNHARAMYFLGQIYETGQNGSAYAKLAVHWYKRSAELGDDDAQFRLGLCYALGKGIEKDNHIAMEYFKMAASQGHAGAKHNIDVMTYYDEDELQKARYLMFGTHGFPRNVPQALELIDKGIRVGDSEALHYRAGLLITGAEPYIAQNIETGIQMMIDAAKQGEVLALSDLMQMYRFGKDFRGVPFEEDLEKAGRLAVEIANAVDPDHYEDWMGMYIAWAAWAYINGFGVQKDYQRANEWLSKLSLDDFKYTGSFAMQIKEELDHLQSGS